MAATTTHLNRHGDIVIPPAIAKQAGLKPGMPVVITVSGQAIIVQPAGAPPRPNLDDLLSQVTEKNRHATITPQD